jgi:hypothetical protein
MNHNPRPEPPFQGQDRAASRRECKRMSAQQRYAVSGNGRFKRIVLVIIDEQETTVFAIRKAYISPIAQCVNRGGQSIRFAI